MQRETFFYTPKCAIITTLSCCVAVIEEQCWEKLTISKNFVVYINSSRMRGRSTGVYTFLWRRCMTACVLCVHCIIFSGKYHIRQAESRRHLLWNGKDFSKKKIECRGARKAALYITFFKIPHLFICWGVRGLKHTSPPLFFGIFHELCVYLWKTIILHGSGDACSTINAVKCPYKKKE